MRDVGGTMLHQLGNFVAKVRSRGGEGNAAINEKLRPSAPESAFDSHRCDTKPMRKGLYSVADHVSSQYRWSVLAIPRTSAMPQ